MIPLIIEIYVIMVIMSVIVIVARNCNALTKTNNNRYMEKKANQNFKKPITMR